MNMNQSPTESTLEKGWVLTINLTPPELKDNTADAERLVASLKTRLGAEHIHIDLSLLKQLPSVLRQSAYHVTCVVFNDRDTRILVSVKPHSDNRTIAGLAVDLGTTRVVLRLLDIERGSVLGEISFDNPQIGIGPDILTRIHFTEKQEGLDTIQQMIVKGFNDHIRVLTQDAGLEPESIQLMAVAGNTTMTHLFLGIEPRYIIREPYIPAVNRPGLFKAVELGLEIKPEARVFVFPNIGSYFGGDLIAGIIYSGIHKKPELSILVDVGTNAEVVLGNNDFLIACAGAAGPALEGGVSSIGMMAGPGAIDRVSLNEEGGLVIHTIDEKKPVGICGSGFIDLAAMLFMSGVIDIRGRIVRNNGKVTVKVLDEMNHLVIVPADQAGTGEDIAISQASLDSLIRSKAAMFTILETIALNVGLSLFDLSTFYVAGTFGSYINPESAITIGMIPDLPLETYKTLGNSSLGGAAMILLNRNLIDEVDKVRDSITYVELNVDQGFMNRFSGAKFLPHTNPELFPSVRVP
ncbi:MAG: ASKHA domain-containing protein [Desulfobacteraceae bacterium]|jgi:uncharacterized 2Fe-2S/4Fe-4S cluster protein (DUF4445 family)